MQKEPAKVRPLKHKQIIFINEYVRCLNASEAARRAQYKGPANVVGPALLANPRIKAEVEKEMAKHIMQPKEILKRLSAQANANLLPFIEIDEDGKTYFDFSHAEAKDHFHIIKKLKTKRKREVIGKGDDKEVWEHEWVEVELHDSQAALEKMCRHWSLFHDKVDISGTVQVLEIAPIKKGANGSGD